MRLVELTSSPVSTTLLAFRAGQDQLAVEIEQLLHTLTQLAFVTCGFDHRFIDGLAALRIQFADGSPVATRERVTQSIRR